MHCWVVTGHTSHESKWGTYPFHSLWIRQQNTSFHFCLSAAVIVAASQLFPCHFSLCHPFPCLFGTCLFFLFTPFPGIHCNVFFLLPLLPLLKMCQIWVLHYLHIYCPFCLSREFSESILNKSVIRKCYTVRYC